MLAKGIAFTTIKRLSNLSSVRANYSVLAFTSRRIASSDPYFNEQETRFCSFNVRRHGGSSTPTDSPKITLTFIDPKLPEDEQSVTVMAHVGETLLKVAHRNGIDIEGACEGVCACSTCHVILNQELYNSLPEPSEDEEDMLDMAFGLTNTSRLACQIDVREGMNGEVIRLPTATRNFYVDGHTPKPH
jgi:ferredoxin